MIERVDLVLEYGLVKVEPIHPSHVHAARLRVVGEDGTEVMVHLTPLEVRLLRALLREALS